MTGFGEIEVIERTTRYRPATKQAFDALQDHLSQTGALMSATPASPDPSTPVAAPAPAAPPSDKIYPHVRLHGPQLRVDAGELAPMANIWEVASKDLCGGIWRTTPWIVEKATKNLITRPEAVKKNDGYFLVRRSIRTRLDTVCQRLADKKLQMYTRPCRGGTDWEYRVLPNEYAVAKILRWRGD